MSSINQSSKSFNFSKPSMTASLPIKLGLALTDFKSSEYRTYQALLQNFGVVDTVTATYSERPSIHHVDAIVFPNRLINTGFQIETDSLIDIDFVKKIKNSKPLFFLGRSGLSFIEFIGETHEILSEEIDPKKTGNFKCTLTPEGREYLNIPEDIRDVIYVNLTTVRLPILASIPSGFTIVSKVEVGHKTYAAAVIDETNNIYIDFTNPQQHNREDSFIFTRINCAKGSILCNYMLQSFIHKIQQQ